tara:strand:- start:4556 stop:4876 length:321 start_codon:yes stop_codon:yes gene_type:complete
MPNTQSPAIDNKFFNNGAGEYDPGLGEVIRSRRHRQEVMERKGLHEVSKNDRDSFLREPEIKPSSDRQMINQVEEAEAMVKSGEWKKGLSEKRIQEIESGNKKGEN